MREKEGYRELLADILEFNGGKRLLSRRRAAQYLGVDPRTAERRLGVGRDGIVATEMARKLCS